MNIKPKAEPWPDASANKKILRGAPWRSRLKSAGCPAGRQSPGPPGSTPSRSFGLPDPDMYQKAL
jgi:hypothetical protein